MKRMLINAAQAEELRVALIQNHSLYDLIVERAGFEQKIGNIYKAKITSVEPSLDAVFVDYGSARHGFLPVKEIAPEFYKKPVDPRSSRRPDLRDILKVGQELTIQVEKEERGNKGAALTTYISLAGSYLVLMPNNPRAGGISRRVEGDKRDELRENLSELSLPADMGLIVRTAGVGKSPEELQWDLNVLLSHWSAIQQASTERSSPFLIHQEGDLVIRSIRDYLRADIEELVIDNKEVYEKAKAHIQQVKPDFVERVKFYDEKAPLFTFYEIEQQIETAYKRTVQLPSGGSLVIDHTEALVAIDINSAGSTKGHNIEATALHTNLEAADEISRQLRLRDIGGLIVIDFIDMTQVKHQREVENAILNGLRLDRARVQISKISRFGLLELSRQRLRPSLRETIQNVCPTCDGHGSVRSVESISLTILRIIEEEAMKPNTSEIEVQASSDTATYLLNEKRAFIRNLEKDHTVNVFIIPNPNHQTHQYNIKRLRRTASEAGDRHKPSYQHLQTPDVDLTASRQAQQRRPQNQPAVRNVLPSRPEHANKDAQDGIIKRLWSNMFGESEEGDQGRSQDERRGGESRQAEASRRQPSRSSQSRRTRSDKPQRDRSTDRSDRPEKAERKPAKRGRPPKRDSRSSAAPGRSPRSDERQKRSPQKRSDNMESTYQEYQSEQPIKVGPQKTATEPTTPKSATPTTPVKKTEATPTKTEATGTSRRPRRVKGPETKKAQAKPKPVSQPEAIPQTVKEPKPDQKPQFESYEQEQTAVKPMATPDEPVKDEPLVVRPKKIKDAAPATKDKTQSDKPKSDKDNSNKAEEKSTED